MKQALAREVAKGQPHVYTNARLHTLSQVREWMRDQRPATMLQRAESWSELCELLGMDWRQP